MPFRIDSSDLSVNKINVSTSFEIQILLQGYPIQFQIVYTLPVTSFSHSSSVSSAVAQAISVAFSRFSSSSLIIPTVSK